MAEGVRTTADRDRHELVAGLRRRGAELVLAMVGVTTPEASGHIDRLREWLADGYHGDMAYLAREDAMARRADLRRTMETVRSVVVVADDYYQNDPPGVPDDPARGVIARYARGRDYHKVLKKKLMALGRWLDEQVGGAVFRAYVDTGPILERELAQRAGLGWFGKNTMLIHPRRGSHFFLGVLLVDVDLPADKPFQADHCGSCRACLDACPTGALLGRDENGAPVMDATRCISYLAIEHRGPIPEELRSLMANRVFGCDICQEVCPYTRKFSVVAAEGDYAARPAWEAEWDRDPNDPEDDGPTEATIPTTDGPALVDLMRMSEDEWDAYTRGSAMRRAGYAGLRRNVAIGIGNWLAASDTPDPEAVGELVAALSDEDATVAEAAAWALGAVSSSRTAKGAWAANRPRVD
ncbi:MAG: tRNA epoxyqueuosine(34) reductase QueG [Gemmatimonadetes bacterium]|nr:tRNA epoxyqueuosine(34) reductase QueG [Gemmatimonadota bacterium]